MGLVRSRLGGSRQNTRDRVSAGLGEQKLVTRQRIAVGLTERQREPPGLHKAEPVKIAGTDAADQIPKFPRLGAAVRSNRSKVGAFRQFTGSRQPPNPTFPRAGEGASSFRLDFRISCEGGSKRASLARTAEGGGPLAGAR
jgi:hypothetical protein